jgi:hypothetical protein
MPGSVCADDVGQVPALDASGGRSRGQLSVYVEVNLAATAAASSRASRRSNLSGMSPRRSTTSLEN